MVDTGERGCYEAQAKAKGDCVKGHSLRTQQAVARFGNAARHSLCLVALDLWALEAERSKLTKDALAMKEFLNSTDQQKKQARALLDYFYKKGKQKETIEAAALVRKLKEHVPKVQKAYQAQVKLLAMFEKFFIYLSGRFGRELLAAERAKNTSALRALPRVQKRWKALSNGARLKYGELRELGILQMLRDKKIRAEWAKGGALPGYMEAAFGSNRPLSDDEWKGRLTAREIHSHLTATDGAGVAGDKDAKEVRRIAKRLRIRLDEDQRGRKWKGPRPKNQEPKRPRGRPREKPELLPVNSIEEVETAVAKGSVHRVVKADSWKVIGEGYRKRKWKLTAQIDVPDAAWAQKVIRDINREIQKLMMLRGGNLGKYYY
jgi:hypothetical protein